MFLPLHIYSILIHDFCFRYPTSIASLMFSHDGSVLAIASSYMYETDDAVDIPQDSIYIRNVSDQETKPKA
jgi:cell cycle arrest protein BUB3